MRHASTAKPCIFTFICTYTWLEIADITSRNWLHLGQYFNVQPSYGYIKSTTNQNWNFDIESHRKGDLSAIQITWSAAKYRCSGIRPTLQKVCRADIYRDTNAEIYETFGYQTGQFYRRSIYSKVALLNKCYALYRVLDTDQLLSAQRL